MPKKANPTPLQQFVAGEIRLFNSYMQFGKRPQHCNLERVRMFLERASKAENIRQFDVGGLLRPQVFFQTLLLQAVHLYGGSAVDYKLVYGHTGTSAANDADVVVQGLELRGAYIDIDSDAVVLQPCTQTGIELRILAQRPFKRRTLTLPLGKVVEMHAQQGSNNTSAKASETTTDRRSTGLSLRTGVLGSLKSIFGGMTQSPSTQTSGRQYLFDCRLNQFLSYQPAGMFRENLATVQLMRGQQYVWRVQMSCKEAAGVDLGMEGVWADV